MDAALAAAHRSFVAVACTAERTVVALVFVALDTALVIVLLATLVIEALVNLGILVDLRRAWRIPRLFLKGDSPIFAR